MKLSKFSALEPVLPGGFPAGDQILISGTPGSGKTILAFQYICEGAESGENGLYVTFDSEKDYLVNQMTGLGFDVKGLIRKGKMDVVEIDPSDVYAALDDIKKHVKRVGAKRLVIDSLSILAVYCGSYKNLPQDLIEFLRETDYQPPIAISGPVNKQMLYHVMKEIRGMGATTLLISELSRDSKWYSRDTVSEFASDGIILLDYHVLGGAGITRTLSIVKMRKAKYREGIQEFGISEKGITIRA